MKLASTSLSLALALTGGACAQGATSEAGTVTDSAGVALADNPDAALAAADIWTLSADPSLEIRSSNEAGYTLFEVVDVVPLAHEGLAVVNSGSDEVLLFDAAGAYRMSLGGEGDGPGEFRNITSAVPMGGDSLGVFDRTHRRLSVFDGGGRLGREVAIELEESARPRLLPLASGDLVLHTHGGFGAERREGSYRNGTETFRLGPDGVRKSSYGSFPGQDVFTAAGMAGATLFGASTYAVTLGDELAVGTAEAPEVRFYATDGRLSRIVRWEEAREPVTDADVAAFVEAMTAFVPEEQRASVGPVLSQVPHAALMPAYQGLLASAEGHLWVGSYRGPAQLFELGARTSPVQSWRVFDAEGRIVATVETPPGFEAMAVGQNGVVGVFKDDLGVESVRAYPITR